MSTMVTEVAVPLAYGTLRERGSKLRGTSRREVRAAPTQFLNLWKLLILMPSIYVL
ncbi:hypothetical protein [Nostoc sp.]|uniref:hypothetical protein n=1 Tax=Nostoc sp. TaxID=1180 RepID=UPI002FF4A6D3